MAAPGHERLSPGHERARAALSQALPTSIQDLHREYSNIFRYGNRNAASHLWSSFIFDRAASLSPELLELMFTGFCAVSGSPTRPGDYTRYRLTLPMAAGGGTGASGYLYYCCWPCVCDTQDFIRVDTKNVTLAGGETRRYHFAVVGSPCDDTSALKVPFVQPFDKRSTTLERDVAMGYASGGKQGMGIVIEVQQGMVNRGADIRYLARCATPLYRYPCLSVVPRP